MAHPHIFPPMDNPASGPFVLANGIKVFPQDFQVSLGGLESDSVIDSRVGDWEVTHYKLLPK